MAASASNSSLHKASADDLVGTTEQSVNEVGRVSAMPLSPEVINNTALDPTTNEGPGFGDSHHISQGNISSQPADDAGSSEPEISTNTLTGAQSQIQTTFGNTTPGIAGPTSEEASRPNTLQVDTVTGFDVGKLVSLMEEQISLLRRIDERQAAGELSQQPMPEVSATSNSTWGALLRTTIAETIQPKIDRWRSGLDALLVFLGLFSAIVTAFLVESLSGLRPDEAARTNELLANLTDIMITLSGVDPMNLNLSAPAKFQPDSTNIRLNSYWSLSLILSLSVAALAVTCRGFLNMVTLSRHAKATDKLIDIRMRWNEADKMLGPVIEMVPQLLVIPVLLFVVGLLDNILSNILQLAVLPTPVMATTSLSFFFIAGVGAFLGYTLFDASIRPRSSPFQSTLAAMITTRIIPMVQSLILWLQAQSTLCLPLHTSNSSSSRGLLQTTTTDNLVIKHYHEVVQAIHDDDTLDKAAAALSSILGPQRYADFPSWNKEEVATLDHLLSPEASIRANRTAAAAIAGLNGGFYEPEDYYTVYIPHKVLIALAHAARRSLGSASLATLETSTFLAAMVKFVVMPADPGPEHPSLIRILGSKYVSLEHKADSIPEVVLLVCDILLNDFVDPSHVNYQHQITTVAALFQPATIKTINVLQALCSVPGRHQERMTEILMEAKKAISVLQAAFEVLELLHDNSVQGLMMVSAIACAGLSRNDFDDHEHLRDLCVKCILNIIQDASFHFPAPVLEGYWILAWAKIPFTEADLANSSNFRVAIEFSIETKRFSQPPRIPPRVMGQNMPMSVLAQLLHQMVETDWLVDFDLDAAIHNI